MIRIFVVFVFSIFISLSSFAHELPVYEETIPTGYWCNLETDKNNSPIGPGDCKKGDVIFDWGGSFLVLHLLPVI